MHVSTAYYRREALTVSELEWLHGELVDRVAAYRFAIRNYPVERMKTHGAPHLAKLEAKVAEVRLLIAAGKED